MALYFKSFSTLKIYYFCTEKFYLKAFKIAGSFWFVIIVGDFNFFLYLIIFQINENALTFKSEEINMDNVIMALRTHYQILDKQVTYPHWACFPNLKNEEDMNK